jgi:putative restriction endonuclease
MRFYLGVTDTNWFNFLSKINPEDVNFWRPGGLKNFKIISSGAPFLFKLKTPINAIGGLGFFSSHTYLPLTITWDTFGIRNGCDSLSGLSKMILGHRNDHTDINPVIGCTILTNPIFFKKEDWIEVPSNWANSIVQGKSYDTQDAVGKHIWNKVEILLERYLIADKIDEGKSQLILEEPAAPTYGRILTKVRLGQGAFRILVTDAYQRRCSISGEKTLPVLEAAHIKPYSLSGPNFISNGILLRSDIHKLFDSGYITITQELRVEVSKRIKEEFQNGKEYYQYHGKEILLLPERIIDKPDRKYLEWHNLNIYKG